MQHAPPGWRNWQAEMLAGRSHADAGRWAGETLGRLHAATAGDAEVAAAFGDYEAFAAAAARAVLRHRDGAPSAARTGARAARGGAARARASASCMATTRPRTCCSGATAHGCSTPRSRTSGTRSSISRSSSRSRCSRPCRSPRSRRPAAGSPSVSREPTRVAREHSRPRRRDRRPHRRDGARAHRRALARDLPLGGRRQARARARQAAAARSGARPRRGRGVVRMSGRSHRARARVRGARLARNADGRVHHRARRWRGNGGQAKHAVWPLCEDDRLRCRTTSSKLEYRNEYGSSGRGQPSERTARHIVACCPGALPQGWRHRWRLRARLPKPNDVNLKHLQSMSRRYGGVGDASTDDTAAIPHAFNNVIKRGGGTVDVPPGRYLFRGTLTLPKE